MKIILILFSLSMIILGSLNAESVTSGYIKVDRDNLFYEKAGNGSVLIFIHDGLVHREIWEHQFDFFSKNHRVIRYDRRGYGKSSISTPDYSSTQDLNSLFSQLGVRKAVLVAMSSGGRLAIDFTLKYPKKVSALVLVGAIVRGLGFTNHFYTRGGNIPSGNLSFQQRREYYATDDPYEIYAENMTAKKEVLRLLRLYPRKNHTSTHRKENGPPAIQRLTEIRIPTLILVGETDIPDVHAHAGAINAGIAGSERDIIPKSGHLIPIEQPVVFNDRVQKFLRDMHGSTPREK